MGRGVSDQPGNTDSVETRHHFRHDMERDGSLSTSVISALAEVEETDVTSLGFVLNDYVDTDALDALFAPTLDGTLREGSRIELELPEHTVTVYSDGHIVVTTGPEASAPDQR